MKLVNLPVSTDRRKTRDKANTISLEARKKNLCSCNIRWGAGGADDGDPWSHCALFIRR